MQFTFLLVLAIGGFMRFYNLDWGSGYFFHPDERLIGTAITKLDFSQGDFNPDFLNYGSLPIYLMHMLAGPSFDKGLLIGRLMAAVLSTLTIAVVYYTVLEIFTHFRGKKLKEKSALEIRPIKEYVFALGAAILTAFSFGMIQGAHFTTPEIYLVLEYALIFYLSLKLIRFGYKKYYILLALTLAAAVATKIISVTLLPVLVVAHFLYLLKFGRHINEMISLSTEPTWSYDSIQMLFDNGKMILKAYTETMFSEADVMLLSTLAYGPMLYRR